MGTVTALKSDAEIRTLEGLCALIEREVERRVRPIEEALEQMKTQSAHSTQAEEYLDIETLAARIHKSPDTIRDWVYKKNRNDIPAIKMPTGGIIFAWSEIERWLRGLES